LQSSTYRGECRTDDKAFLKYDKEKYKEMMTQQKQFWASLDLIGLYIIMVAISAPATRIRYDKEEKTNGMKN
jgi:hypothetical protein